MLAIPRGAYGRIAPHSGLALKGIDIAAGVIDSDYRGEVKVLLVNHSDMQFKIKMGDRIAQLIIEKISLDRLNEENNLGETKQGDQGFRSTGVAETPKISILKRPENKLAKVAESPRGILPEKVDKQPSHKEQPAKAAESPRVILPERMDKQPSQKETAESSKPMAMVILPAKVDKQSRQGWMNTVDPWMSQWIKKVLDSNDEERAIKHVRSFVHESRQEQVTPRLIRQLREINKLEAQFMLRELQQKLRFVQHKRQSNNAFKIKATLESPSGETLNVITLLDSRCTRTTIDERFAKEKGLKTYKLPVPIPVYNVDGSINSTRSIREFAIVEMRIGDHSKQIAIAMSNLSTHPIFLGYDWLRKHNPQIDWKAKTLQFTCENEHTPGLLDPEIDNKEAEPERLFMINYEYFRNLSTDIAIVAGESKQTKTFEEIVPEAYHEYKDIFAKEMFDELPPCRPWNHAIKLLPGNHKVSCKIYNLTTAEQKELDNFLEENLSTGCI